MDIENLIERLNQYSQSLIAYKLGADFADACMAAATALSTLQAENSQLRAYLESEREPEDAYYEESGLAKEKVRNPCPTRPARVDKVDRKEDIGS